MITSKVVSKTSTITLNGPLAQTFPLFGPLREREWAEGWQPRMVLPYATDIEEHMVFQTEAQDEQSPATYTWIVSKYDPAEARIEYTVFSGARIWWITIQCGQDTGGRTTSATITYTYLGLTEHANQLNHAALTSMFRHDLRDWQEALNHYLTHGVRLSHSSRSSSEHP